MLMKAFAKRRQSQLKHGQTFSVTTSFKGPRTESRTGPFLCHDKRIECMSETMEGLEYEHS